MFRDFNATGHDRKTSFAISRVQAADKGISLCESFLGCEVKRRSILQVESLTTDWKDSTGSDSHREDPAHSIVVRRRQVVTGYQSLYARLSWLSKYLKGDKKDEFPQHAHHGDKRARH